MYIVECKLRVPSLERKERVPTPHVGIGARAPVRSFVTVKLAKFPFASRRESSSGSNLFRDSVKVTSRLPTSRVTVAMRRFADALPVSSVLSSQIHYDVARGAVYAEALL